ncbi:MAG TPA: sn-glycerol-3-phosphate ABC transporter ATP-binding protein UgpC [Acidimicrobiales bacterium]|nr:sn-glycerol-3-phosphate ABC transporter ATP-binding protein UgpC [Acidimicrobiales bacterium]
MAPINLEKVSKRYPNGFEAVHELDLDVSEGELMVLVGPSGCGKTTALRMVAGLEDITGGTLRIGGQVVNDVSPRDRDVAMVFQNYALYPHMTVSENIGFSLKLRKMPKAQIQQKVSDAANILGLTEWLNRKPAQLSGGQRQRVAMGRAIVREPSVFLMDEPLSNLDAKLRVQMRAEVSRIQRRIGVATLYVTHDQTEAMTMGDRVAVLRTGRLQQCNAPQVLYDRPDNLFVAAFIGSPAMNLYRAQLTEGAQSLQLGSQAIRLPESVRLARPGLVTRANSPVVVGIRPEDLPAASADTSTPDSQDLEGEVDLVEALGSELLVHFTIDARRVRAEDVQDDAAGLEGGELAVQGEGVARVEPRTEVKVGQRTRFRVSPERIHFFDNESGIAIW